MKFVRAFFRHPKIIVAVCVIASGCLGFFIKDLSISNSSRDFFPQKDASYDRMTETERTFGSMLSIGVSIEAKRGTILTPEYINVVNKISDRALELHDVEDVDSISDIDFVCDENGVISATPLIPDEHFDADDNFIGTPEMMSQLKLRLSEWDDMYDRVIINDSSTATQIQFSIVPKGDAFKGYDDAKENLDLAKAALADATASGDATAVEDAAKAVDEAKKALKAAAKTKRYAKPDSDRQAAAYYAIKKIVEEECAGHEVEYRFYGDPVLSDNSKSFMITDLSRLIPLVVIVVIVTLYLSFHTVAGTVLPLLTVLMSAMQACGLMGLLHINFTLVSSVIPVALIACGSAYGIHVMTHYYVALSEVKGEITKEMYEDAIFKGLSEVWMAVLLAGLTTVVGFISLITSPLEPLHSFAIFTAVGIAVTLVLSVTFIPAILLLKSYKNVKHRNRIEQLTDKVREKMDRAQQRRGGRSVEVASGETLYKFYRFFCGTGPRLIITSLAIVILSVWGLSKLKIDTSFVNYFPKKSQFRIDLDYVDKEFAGSNSLYINITGPDKGDITNPELLKAVDDMEEYLNDKYQNVGKIVSLTGFIKRINQVWHVPVLNASGSADVTADVSSTEGGESLDSWGDSLDDGWEDDDFASDTEELDSDFGGGELDSWASEFDDDTAGSETAASSAADDWVDPNKAYAEALVTPVTTQEVLQMLRDAYVKAGGKTASIDEIVEVLMAEMNYNGMAYYEIPYEPKKYPVATREELQQVVNNYLTLLSGSLERFIDDDMSPKVMRIQCQLRDHSTEKSGLIIADARAFAEKYFPKDAEGKPLYKLEATGTAEMEYTMTNMIVSSQLTSLLLSLLSVFIIITVSFKSGWAGLLGAIPLAFTILLNYMMMGFTGINLDLITSIIASVAVGVGIDYTIHFLTTYKEERALSRDLTEVTKNTFRKSGHGIVTNATAVAFGFIILMLSKFVVLRYIGVLVAIVMFTSSFLAMTIIPGILNITDPRFMRPKSEPKAEIVPDDENGEK